MPEPITKPQHDQSSVDVLDGPSEDAFWDKYNKRLEFPLSTVSAILVHVLIGSLLVFGIFRLMNRDDDKSGVPVSLVNIDGLDSAGLGSTGSGGQEDVFVKANATPATAPLASLIDLSKLPEIKENLRETIKHIDPSGKMPISDENAAHYKSLSENVRNKLLGGQQGSGNDPGSGHDNSKGKGPGGSASDSTLGRNMRWVLRFKVTGGRDYLDQLKSMQATILVPVPDSDKCIFFPDLTNLNNQRIATDGDLRVLADQIKFSDARRDAVQGVAGALGLDFRPQTFWAFFPKGTEDDLARKETSWRNKRSEDIEETIFRVTIRGGTPEIVVDEQKLKRK